MKVFTVVAGAVIVVAYAVWGMLVMNHLGLVAGSGLPLDETLATMESAGERASMVFGYVFAALGGGSRVGGRRAACLSASGGRSASSRDGARSWSEVLPRTSTRASTT